MTEQQMQTDANYQPFSQSQYEAPDGSYYESEDKYDPPLSVEGDENYNDAEQHPDAPEDCPKCDGSGTYDGHGPMGVQPCYACKGKGWQDDADVRRNAAYFRRNPHKA